jgi:hypothetical protein
MSILDRCKTLVRRVKSPFYLEGLDETYYYLENGDDVETRPVACFYSDGSITASDIKKMRHGDYHIPCEEEHLKKYLIVKSKNVLQTSKQVHIFGDIGCMDYWWLLKCGENQLNSVICAEVSTCVTDAESKRWVLTTFILSNLVCHDRHGNKPEGLYADIEVQGFIDPSDTPESLFQSGELAVDIHTTMRHQAKDGKWDMRLTDRLWKLHWTPKSKQVG